MTEPKLGRERDNKTENLTRKNGEIGMETTRYNKM